jgi:hypothetical protein
MRPSQARSRSQLLCAASAVPPAPAAVTLSPACCAAIRQVLWRAHGRLDASRNVHRLGRSSMAMGSKSQGIITSAPENAWC